MTQEEKKVQEISAKRFENILRSFRNMFEQLNSIIKYKEQFGYISTNDKRLAVLILKHLEYFRYEVPGFYKKLHPEDAILFHDKITLYNKEILNRVKNRRGVYDKVKRPLPGPIKGKG